MGRYGLELGQVDAEPGERVPVGARREIARPRLRYLLDESGARAILIAAPAGHGKTTLAEQWLAGKRAARYRPSRASSDVAAFAVELAEAAATIVPDADKRVRQRVRTPDGGPASALLLAELLARDLTAWPDDAWVLIDEYEHVDDAASVTEFVDLLLTLSPIRLLVTSRVRPAWASARRVLYGELTELRHEQLAMTDAEALEVLEGLPEDTRRAVVARAHGWPMLIGLAALAAASELPAAHLSDTLFEYVAVEVYQREPPEVRQVMLRASIPLEIDRRSATTTVVAASEAALTRLEEEGLLHRTGEDTYRFHPLVRDFLRAQLRREDRSLFEALSAQSSRAARDAQRWEEAYEIALGAGDTILAADVVGEAAPHLFEAGRYETVEQWLVPCQAIIEGSPALEVARIEILLYRNRVYEARAAARALGDRLPDEDPHAWHAWYRVGRACERQADDESALAANLRARATASTTGQLVRALWGAINSAHRLEREVIVGLVGELTVAAGRDPAALGHLASARTQLASYRGDLSGVWDELEPLVAVSRTLDPMARVRMLQAAAYVKCSHAEYRSAHELVTEAIAIAGEFHLESSILGNRLYLRSQAETGLRNFGAAERTLDGYASLALTSRAHAIARLTARWKLLLATGELDRILDESKHERWNVGPKNLSGEAGGLVALAAAAAGDAERAAEMARLARTLSRTPEPRTYARFADVIAGARLGAAETLRGELVAAVQDAFARGVHDAFVLSYRAYPPLLELAAGEKALCSELRHVVSNANDHALARTAGLIIDPGATAANEAAALTRREQQVLELVAEGLTNAEIGRRLFITEGTAKLHVHHILEKLGVRNRLRAVAVARKLDPNAPGDAESTPVYTARHIVR